VTINEARAFSPKVFVTIFLLTGIIAIIALVALVDLEIIDFGLSLPFDVL
jgi:uncharacterized membrane protein